MIGFDIMQIHAKVFPFPFKYNHQDTKNQSNRLRLRSSGRSSSDRSAVSAGFNREWTLLAMLDRRVAGSEDSCRGYRDPKVNPFSALSMDDDGGSLTGGEIWRYPSGGGRRGAPISYCANTSRTCWSLELGVRCGDGGHAGGGGAA